MKLRKLQIYLAIALAGIAGGLLVILSGCSDKSDRTAAKEGTHAHYTCGMHPQVIQDKPGNCPICGMKLTPMRATSGPAATAGTGAQSTAIAVDAVTRQAMGIRTAAVTRGPLRRVIRTVGAIDYNEASMADVTTKFKGWIEKLNVNATGELVMRGDPLFEIYSPELYSAQREYLLTIRQGTNSSGAALLKDSARNKLKFYDISDEQIAELDRTGEPRKTLQVFAPQDGFVVEKMALQGQMVDAGMKLYRLADLGLVWAQAQIYEQDLPYLKLGQEAIVTLSYLPDREFRGRLTYIYPNVDEKTRTARVRMEFHNPGYFLKPGMFATVQISAELEPSALLVPDMAILRSGEKNTVFVAKEGGTFEARTIRIGSQGEDDNYQVLAGLEEGERIVTSGQFMLDSESQLREAIQKMTVADKTGGSAGLVTSNINNAAENKTGTGKQDVSVQGGTDIKYICPMPEHVSIEYMAPGKCPICGMTLVPVTAAALAKLQPGGKLLHYTCPMPEHADVHLDKPGKCPKCSMTLIPVMTAPPPLKISQPTNSIGAGVTLYTCPMAEHDVVSDKPGICPKCDMKLVPTGTVKHGKMAEEHWARMHAGQGK